MAHTAPANFARGGAGIVFTEAAAVEPIGRISHGDLGIWSDRHMSALKSIAEGIRRVGAVPALELAHAGRKASTQRPWEGNNPLSEIDGGRGDPPGPSSARPPKLCSLSHRRPTRCRLPRLLAFGTLFGRARDGRSKRASILLKSMPRMVISFTHFCAFDQSPQRRLRRRSERADASAFGSR